MCVYASQSGSQMCVILNNLKDVRPCSQLETLMGGWGCLMALLLSGLSGLSFDSTFLSPLLFFLPSPPAPSVLFLLVVSSPVLCVCVCVFLQKILQHFSLRDRLLSYGSC